MPESQNEREVGSKSVDTLSSELRDLVSRYTIDLENQAGEFAFEALRSATLVRAKIIQKSADLCLLCEDPKSSLDDLFAHIDSSFSTFFESAAQQLKDDINTAISALD